METGREDFSRLEEQEKDPMVEAQRQAYLNHMNIQERKGRERLSKLTRKKIRLKLKEISQTP